MTLENLNYRTDPMFLRNQFLSSNAYGIPDVPKAEFNDDELKELRLLAFNQTKSDNGKHSERIVHFFLYDYNFENIWNKPEKFVERLSKYKGVLSPDFSMYTEMPYAVQIYNTFRNRWCGAYLASKGIKVIPTVSWSDSGSFDFCFKGIPKGSIVAVSTYMFHESKHHADQKELFMEGYNRMLKEIEPSKIICYSEPFKEMQGDIIYIDYELSSWKHLSDDKSFLIKKPPLNRNNVVIKYYGYVCKGGGSAKGGEWIPKCENDERFLGEPNTIRNNTVTTTKGSYNVKDYYDETGHAVAERHFTIHTPNDAHSNPHDHLIGWEKGHPDFSSPINYFNGARPFTDFILDYFGEIADHFTGDEKSMKNREYKPNNYKFETLGEFKIYLSCGANVGFEYNGIEYGIEGHNNSFHIWTANAVLADGLTLEETLDYKLDGVKIKDLILDAKIIERIM